MDPLGRLSRMLVALTCLLMLNAGAAGQTRVACMGDSITAGQGAGQSTADRAYAAYPAVLGRLLGPEWTVQGFGAPGHTLRPDGPRPYGASKAFADGCAFRPDIAVVMLGTNDSYRDEDPADWGAPVAQRVNDLVSALREGQPGVRVLLASPPAIFPGLKGLTEDRQANLRMRQPRIDQISQALRVAARGMDDVEFVDTRSILRERDVTDGVHPNAFGAERLAYRLAGAISLKTEEVDSPWSRLLEARPDAALESYRGFRRASFRLDGLHAPASSLVQPDRIGAGAPWVLRSGPLSETSAIDHELLDHGFHLLHVPHGELPSVASPADFIGEAVEFARSTLGLGPRAVQELKGEGESGREQQLREHLRRAGLHSAESDPSVHATPSAEYRGASAGWGGGTWRTALESLEALAEEAREAPPVDVLFLGDSITQGLTGHVDRYARADGDRAFDRYLGGRRAVSVGLSGDRTEHILHRIATGSLDGFRPRVVVLQIGINNINAAGHTGEETFRGILAVLESLRGRFPDTKVLLCGPFPAGQDPLGRVRQSVLDVHERLDAESFGAGIHRVNLSGQFIGEDGQPLPTLGRDSLHITSLGKDAWMSAIEPVLVELLD